MSSAPALLEALGRRCDGSHRHQVREDGRAAAAARYPAGLCRAILRGAEEQRHREGRHVPAGVQQLQAHGLGVFELRRAGDATAGQVLEIDANVLEEEVGDAEEGKAAYGGGDPTDLRRSALRTPQMPLGRLRGHRTPLHGSRKPWARSHRMCRMT